MAQKNLRIDQLALDLINPRITQASSQREAMQRIIDDQGVKCQSARNRDPELASNRDPR